MFLVRLYRFAPVLCATIVSAVFAFSTIPEAMAARQVSHYWMSGSGENHGSFADQGKMNALLGMCHPGPDCTQKLKRVT